MMRRMNRIAVICVVTFLTLSRGAASAQELEIETDARLEGYADKVALEPSNTAMTWAAFGFCAAVTLLGLFKDAKRSHLD